MRQVDYLIIGGGVAGTSAAEFIRMHDSSGSITIITEEPELLYSRVMLPHYLRDQVPFEKLYVRKPQQYDENKIELLKNTRANKIDTQKKEVDLSNGEKISYEKLLIASGGKVNKLQVPGVELKGITYLRTIQDAQEIKELISKVNNGVVVGGGFIGIEYSQSFVKAGLSTTCIIREPYFWSSVVGENIGRVINRILEENGVKIISENEVGEFIGEGGLEEIKLKDGKKIPVGIVGIGIGIRMDLDHLEGSGIKTNKGVVTNEYLETETKDIWAAGDIAEFYDALFDKYRQMGNWSNAAAQGKVVGTNMVAGWGPPAGGGREKFVTVSAYTISIFDKTFTLLGEPVADNKTETIERGSVEEEKLGNIHLRNGVISGAALLNLPADRRPIEELIKNRIKIETSKEKLTDTSFSLNNLLSN
ncbi:MAG: hypothetical protein A2Z11_04490 [Candidatus Woykebacteria bacterium RBG_16_43_9]|uniref:FAD/NAD(P)-binding domain-containing protein n=1 Tax=Candidatus Woykebacteria bacterium RBG_16_43_9 TaxID=1802596 RepID=A0A1G1WDH3_9BACT|nr:MAG: hypothetical protein A2Z11_04490 [Candidatus Woykebacteria bacterium RBG_16_43_9]